MSMLKQRPWYPPEPRWVGWVAFAVPGIPAFGIVVFLFSQACILSW